MLKQIGLNLQLAVCLVALTAVKASATPILVQDAGPETASFGGASGKVAGLVPPGYERVFSSSAAGLPKAGGPEVVYDSSALAGSPVRSPAAGVAAGGPPSALVDGTLSKQVAVPEPACLTILAMAAVFCAGFKRWRPRRV